MTTPSEALAAAIEQQVKIWLRLCPTGTSTAAVTLRSGDWQAVTAALRSAPVPGVLSEEEIARRLALAGLAADRVRRTPPHWEEKDWQRRVLECIPSRDEAHCREVARALLTPAETAPHPAGGDGIVERLTRIADASRREDGSDIPLGSYCREAAAEIERLQAQIAQLTESEGKLRTHVATIHNKLRHEFSAAVDTATEQMFRAMSGISVLRALASQEKADA